MSVPTNRSNVVLHPFDVVVVPFPYADRLAEKRRPAIVISQPALTQQYGLVWLAMVTSAGNASWNCDVAVTDLKISGLPVPSVVRPAKIANVDATRILSRIGRLSTKDIANVKRKLAELMAH
jgi:mRNA interferase MazF